MLANAEGCENTKRPVNQQAIIIRILKFIYYILISHYLLKILHPKYNPMLPYQVPSSASSHLTFHALILTSSMQCEGVLNPPEQGI
jgi:hypothetical protein